MQTGWWITRYRNWRSWQYTPTHWLMIFFLLMVATVAGIKASLFLLGVVAIGIAAILTLIRPVMGLFGVVIAALLVPLEFGTGTAVSLNPVTLVVPALLLVWLIYILRTPAFSFARATANLPLTLFLLASFLSIFVGNVLWHPAVPRPHNFLLVQLAQWGIFFISAIAFWLAANWVGSLKILQSLTICFLLIGCCFGVLYVMPNAGTIASQITTFAFFRPPFWILLAGLAGGQLLYNNQLRLPLRLLCLIGIVLPVLFAFVVNQESASTWTGVSITFAFLFWTRWKALRPFVLLLLLALGLSGLLINTIYEFAGGEQEWVGSGESRLLLVERVIEETMQNPITGLGPAAYRPYTRTKPLSYGYAFWVDPQISAHNNYVDLFAHAGLLGLGLFLWFVWEWGRLGMRLYHQYSQGFAAGYVNGMLAVGIAMLGIMFLADWGLPFVYNIGFPGFQASVLVWLFMGGMVAVDQQGKNGH